jgi:excisionase family DNA binding protein
VHHAIGGLVLNSQPLLDINSVATQLGTSVRHIRRLVAEKRIPYLKVGHLVRFDPTELEVWLQRSRCDADRWLGGKSSCDDV